MGILKGNFSNQEISQRMQHRAVHTDSLSVVVPLVRMSMSVLLCR